MIGEKDREARLQPAAARRRAIRRTVRHEGSNGVCGFLQLLGRRRRFGGVLSFRLGHVERLS
jgi:hypothetical protein